MILLSNNMVQTTLQHSNVLLAVHKLISIKIVGGCLHFQIICVSQAQLSSNKNKIRTITPSVEVKVYSFINAYKVYITVVVAFNPE